ncbi:class I SAM-dependent methyltransferase [Marinobacter sp. HN1S83]|uniref:class I SAM-dependent methyltransferase n=1 Tax=Marinobacter sp. HN1S83 TaxID=3382301 RepID=UPI00387B6436
MSSQTLDYAKAEAFAGHMLDVLNHAALAQMASIGHQIGLFDIMADLPPSTDKRIAEVAGLNQRYVREWLGAMVTGLVIDYDPENATYSLPPEHAATLTRSAGPDNLARPAQFIPLLAQVEESILERFRNGGGLPYSAYPRFHQLMAEDSAAIHDVALVDSMLPIVPGLVERLQAGIQVADVGCGCGHAINLMAQAFPKSQFVGYDISEEGLREGRREAQELGLTNAQFELRDASSLDVQNRFDFISAFDAIHDQAQPARVLTGIAQALRPQGVFLMVDFGASSKVHENLDFPAGPFMYTISCMHCVPVSMGLNGPGLGAMWGEQTARQMLTEAGFTQVEVKQVEGDIFNNYFIASRG